MGKPEWSSELRRFGESTSGASASGRHQCRSTLIFLMSPTAFSLLLLFILWFFCMKMCFSTFLLSINPNSACHNIVGPFQMSCEPPLITFRHPRHTKKKKRKAQSQRGGQKRNLRASMFLKNLTFFLTFFYFDEKSQSEAWEMKQITHFSASIHHNTPKRVKEFTVHTKKKVRKKCAPEGRIDFSDSYRYFPQKKKTQLFLFTKFSTVSRARNDSDKAYNFMQKNHLDIAKSLE